MLSLSLELLHNICAGTLTDSVEPLLTTSMFDPRRVPVLAAEPLLPPVHRSGLDPQSLRLRFASPPHWVPELREEVPMTDQAPCAASVLVPLVMRERLTVLLTQRAAHLPTHAGQIAFPGGKQDQADPSPVHAALREAQEEVGLDIQHIEVLGTLPVYRTGTAFVVTPVVALVSPHSPWQPNPHEVADVFEVPLDYLMNPAHHRRHELEWEGRLRSWYSMPYDDGGQERWIWGATAGMLRNFYRFLSA
jgi:8-oxo-dGTP pyrophosphatase MutT (NUDIX family)